MMSMFRALAVCLLGATLASAFQAPLLRSAAAPSATSLSLSSQSGGGKTDADFMRWARASRSAGANDNVVELLRPLGLVLNEDKRTGNVFVETVAPNGNAARTGKVRELR